MTKRKLQLVSCQHPVNAMKVPDRSAVTLTFTRELSPIELLGLRAIVLDATGELPCADR